MKIFVTGGTGFIGNAFLRCALGQGHELGCLVRSTGEPTKLLQHPRIRWFEGTLAEAPWSQISTFGPEVCLHSAWISAPGVYLESPENTAWRDWSMKLFENLSRLGARRGVVLGTCIEYASSSGPLKEDISPAGPASAYARAKHELHQWLDENFSGNLAWARVFYPYGPGEHPARLCSSILRKLMRGEKVTLGTPNSVKDYIFIEDLANAILAVVTSSFSGAINLGTGEGISVREIARLASRLLGKTALVSEASPAQADPYPFVVADASRIKALGWTPKVSFEQGLTKLLATLDSAPV